MRSNQPWAPLLIVGFLKCGTTSLSRYLSHHPEIATPLAKELYYFVDEGSSLVSMQNVVNKVAFGKETTSETIEFHEYFSERAEKKYLMDATPFSYSQQSAIEFMKNHPRGKVIFMLRDPAKRLLSSFRFFQGMYQEYPKSSFNEFTNALLDIEGARVPYRERIAKEFFKELFDSEVDMGCYVKHIRRWKKELSPDQIFVGTMEQLRDEPREMMENLCEFLDISTTCYGDFEFRPFMQSYEVRFSWLQKLGRKLGKEDPMRFDRISQFQNPFHRIPINGIRTRLESLYKSVQHSNKEDDFTQSFALLDTIYRDANSELFSDFRINYQKKYLTEQLS
jgi:hypothetical protein